MKKKKMSAAHIICVFELMGIYNLILNLPRSQLLQNGEQGKKN
jgi:hypothetical protein